MYGYKAYYSLVVSKKKLQNQIGHINQNSLSEQQKQLLALGAILSYHRGEEILSLVPNEVLDRYFYGLRNQWQISNSQEAKQTLSGLLALQNSLSFEPLFVQNSPQLEKVKKSIAKKLEIDFAQVEAVNTAYAWDIGRVASLAKWCYWCGYITEEEMWSILQKALEITKQNSKNWQEYTISFLLGRTLQGFDLEDVYIEARQLFKSKNPMLGKVKDIDVYQKYPL
ncbi:MAG: DUF1266 domain-containing protein [Capnocytophaga sp.]|nr:DUF1266 domain-containing protein [Capnocytophaga sp.]